MNTQAIKHAEIINVIKAQIQLNDALTKLVSKLEEEENQDKYIYVKEAAKIAEMSDVNVRNLINSGLIKAKRNGKKWKVYKPSLMHYLEWKRN